MKAYLEYKLHESTWFKRLPSHWIIKKVRNILVERNEIVSDTVFPPLSVSKMGVSPQLANVAKSSAGDKRKAVYKGDFVINSRSDRRGSSGVSDYTGSVSLIYFTFSINDLYNKKFIHFLLKSNGFIEEFYRNGHGIVADLWTTNIDNMKNIFLPIPPRGEQDNIVRFLEYKLSTIDRLIANNFSMQSDRKICLLERKIQLLQEYRTRLISDLVTGSIDVRDQN